MSQTKLVIVGGVAAGTSAAAKARRCSEEANIILFEAGADISYATCGLPYYVSGVIPNRNQLLITSSKFFKNRFDVDVRTSHEVLRIDREAKQLYVKNLTTGGQFEESYDKLILATGSSATRPPIPGISLPFVFTHRTLEDADRLFSFLRDSAPKRAVVLGGGLIGMEVADNLAVLGLHVSVVEAFPQVLGFLDPEMSEVVRHHLEENGVDVFASEPVVSIEQSAGRGQVVTKTGRRLDADVVIVATGIRPNTKLASECGLRIGTKGGIQVSAQMQTSDSSIWAAGDCVEATNLVTGKSALVPMGAAANKQGRAAGANAMGRNLEVKGFAGTVIVKVFDLAAAKTGLSEREAAAEGFNVVATYVHGMDHASYYPEATALQIKTISDRDSGRLLGAQVVGQKGVDKRIDVFATAIYGGMNTEDLIQLDLAYAPPYSSARDPIIVAGALGQNFASGDWSPITPAQLNMRVEQKDDFLLVDVRTARELKMTGVIPGAIHIPIDDLRNRSSELDPGKDIVLYCAAGLRSYLGNRILALKGFRQVKTLTGGMGSWTYPVSQF